MSGGSYNCNVSNINPQRLHQVDHIIAMFQTSTHNDCITHRNTNTTVFTCLSGQLQKHTKGMGKCIRVLAVLVYPLFDLPLVDGKPHHAACQLCQLNPQQPSQCSHGRHHRNCQLVPRIRQRDTARVSNGCSSTAHVWIFHLVFW